MAVIEWKEQRIEFNPNEPVGAVLATAGVKDAIGILQGETFFDLQTPTRTEGSFVPVLPNTKQGLELLRHTAAHVMAQAVARLYGNVEFAIGPVIDDGFYYDFDLEHVFSPEDFPKIE
ncbi:MAG: threonine--tRNA ligase, partial [bacterium]|nr:threonine--tRNA ligase [bacterium]